MYKQVLFLEKLLSLNKYLASHLLSEANVEGALSGFSPHLYLYFPAKSGKGYNWPWYGKISKQMDLCACTVSWENTEVST